MLSGYGAFWPSTVVVSPAEGGPSVLGWPEALISVRSILSSKRFAGNNALHNLRRAVADFQAEHSFAEAAKLVTKGVICLRAELQLHWLTVKLPPLV